MCPPGQAQQAIAAGLGVVPAFHGRRGRAQQHRNAREPGAGHGHVAGRVTQPLLLLVGWVVLLVDDDGVQMGDRRQNGQPCAQHDARLPAGGSQPVAGPGCVGHLAVQHGNGLPGKAAPQLLLQRGRQADLRHHHQHLGLWITVQPLGHPVQIHLGLAAARDAVQQPGWRGRGGASRSGWGRRDRDSRTSRTSRGAPHCGISSSRKSAGTRRSQDCGGG